MLSQKYHDIFNYKLTKEELVKWQYKNFKERGLGVKNKARIQNEIFSNKKIKLAQRASKLISKIPTIKFIGITGALAMMNASRDSDIDLLIITKSGYLWTTRLLTLLILLLTNTPFRRANRRDEKNKLCLNMWLDEEDLIWNKKDRNLYTAHEIAQIVPTVDKDNTYEKFLYLNRWILNYWPNAVKIIKNIKNNQLNKKYNKYNKYNIGLILEKVAFHLQYLYMKRKMTRETINSTRAIFHPNDWGKKVLTILQEID